MIRLELQSAEDLLKVLTSKIANLKGRIARIDAAGFSGSKRRWYLVGQLNAFQELRARVAQLLGGGHRE